MTAIPDIRRRWLQATATHRARLGRVLRFGLIGLSGTAVNTAALGVVTGVGGLHYVAGAVLATQVSTTYNFALTNHFVFVDDGDHRFGPLARYVQFSAVNNSMLLLRVPIIIVLTTAGLHYLASNVVSMLVLFVVRFVVADQVIWRRTAAAVPERVPTARGSSVDG